MKRLKGIMHKLTIITSLRGIPYPIDVYLYCFKYITSLTSLTVLPTSGNAAVTRFGA